MRCRRALAVGAVIAGVAGAGAGAVDAGGPGNTHLAAHGWTCLTAGPHGWVHCFPPGFDRSDRTISVRVFDSTDIAVDGGLLGTELLIHDDVFAGQPCPQDDGEYEPLDGTPFWACHHFDT